MRDHFACSQCGAVHHIDALDAKDDGPGNFTVLLCSKCYGPGYAAKTEPFSPPLGPLIEHVPAVQALQAQGEHKAAKIVSDVLVAMASIDSRSTKSAYYIRASDQEDRPPTGDDYNDLWQAVLSALLAES